MSQRGIASNKYGRTDYTVGHIRGNEKQIFNSSEKGKKQN